MTIADIEILARLLVGTDSNGLTAAQLLILDNRYYEEIVGKIIAETAGARTQFGDLNYTTFPTEEITMTNSQPQYDLNDISTTPLTIMGIEVLDENGTWHIVDRTSLREIHEKGIAKDEYQSTDGRPQEFEIRDNHIVLYPAPDNGVSVTLSSGLRIYYLRTADVFTSAQQSTGTKEPGFPSPWHHLIAYGAAADFAMGKSMNNATFLRREYERGLNEMLKFIARRDQDFKKAMSPKEIQYT